VKLTYFNFDNGNVEKKNIEIENCDSNFFNNKKDTSYKILNLNTLKCIKNLSEGYKIKNNLKYKEYSYLNLNFSSKNEENSLLDSTLENSILIIFYYDTIYNNKKFEKIFIPII